MSVADETVEPAPSASPGPSPTTPTPDPAGRRRRDLGVTRRLLSTLDVLRSKNPAVLFVLSLFGGLVVSSIVIVLSNPQLRSAWGDLFSDPANTFSVTFRFLGSAYGALLRGAIADPASFRRAFAQPTSANWAKAFLPIANTIVSSVPLIITALGLSIAYRSGAFNMGGQSQLILGAVAASWVGFSFAGMPWLPHVLLAFLAALLAGAVAGLIPGVLKAYTGASEVIVTIMLNYIAANFLTFLLSSTFFRINGQGDNPVGRLTLPSAALGRVFGPDLPINGGVFVAIIAAVAVAVLLNRSRLGFEFQIAGASRNAARVAGIRQAQVYLGAFALSGAVVGLAGGVQILGVTRQLQTGFGADIGYLAILVAFVGNNRPLSVTLAALLYGALQTGGLTMQFSSGISYQLTSVIQALIVLFVTAPALIGGIFRLRDRGYRPRLRTRPAAREGKD
jgi:general nucleoside transport system permease protein